MNKVGFTMFILCSKGDHYAMPTPSLKIGLKVVVIALIHNCAQTDLVRIVKRKNIVRTKPIVRIVSSKIFDFLHKKFSVELD